MVLIKYFSYCQTQTAAAKADVASCAKGRHRQRFHARAHARSGPPPIVVILFYIVYGATQRRRHQCDVTAVDRGNYTSLLLLSLSLLYTRSYVDGYGGDIETSSSYSFYYYYYCTTIVVFGASCKILITIRCATTFGRRTIHNCANNNNNNNNITLT